MTSVLSPLKSPYFYQYHGVSTIILYDRSGVITPKCYIAHGSLFTVRHKLNQTLKLYAQLLLIICLGGCSLYYHQSQITPVDSAIVSGLETKYGPGGYYELYTGLDKVHKSDTGEIIGARREAASELNKLNLCGTDFEILPETYQTYEYGVVTITIKCFADEPNA